MLHKWQKDDYNMNKIKQKVLVFQTFFQKFPELEKNYLKHTYFYPNRIIRISEAFHPKSEGGPIRHRITVSNLDTTSNVTDCGTGQTDLCLSCSKSC